MSRRFTRLTNAFSKRLLHLKAAVSLHFAYYDFCRISCKLEDNPGKCKPGLLIMFGNLLNYLWRPKTMFV